METDQKLLAAIKIHQEWLRSLSGFSGAGLGVDQSQRPCIKVFTNKMPADVRQQILHKLESLPVDFEEVGEIRAL